MTHTKTPWKLSAQIKPSVIVNCDNNNVIAITDYCTFSYEQQKINAAFIVKAVNCHDELLEACIEAESVMKWLDETDGMESLDEDCIFQVWNCLKKAIQKAEGK